MESILENFDINKNFWSYNPQFKAIKQFKELYDKDKSEEKSYSSKVMWSIALLVHPRSIFYNLDEDDKKELIYGDYIKDNRFTWKKYENLITLFTELVLTRAKRSLSVWENKLRERDKLIEEEKYTIDNAEELDKILKNTYSLWSQYKQIQSDVMKEGEVIISKGGGEPSLSDKGII